MAMDLTKALQIAAVGGAGYLVYKKFFAADDSAEPEEDIVDDEDANEPDELAALNNPGGLKRFTKKLVGPLTRKIRNKKRKMAALRAAGDMGAKFARLEAQVEELKSARLAKMVEKHGEAKVREMMAKKLAEKGSAKGIPFVAAESLLLSGGTGTTSQEAEEDAIVSQLMAVAEIEPGEQA